MEVARDDAALATAPGAATAAGATTAVKRSAKPATARAATARARLRTTRCVLPLGNHCRELLARRNGMPKILNYVVRGGQEERCYVQLSPFGRCGLGPDRP